MSVKFHESYALDSQQDQLLWWDDFLGDQVQDEWAVVTAATSTGAVVDQQTGGIFRIGLPNNADRTYIWWNNRRTFLVTKRMSMETRLKLSVTAGITGTIYMMFDFNNYVRFETSGANWFIRNRDGGAGGSFDTGIALDTSYHIFRIECHTHGGNHVHYYIDGTQTANSPITTNVPDDAGDYLQPRIDFQSGDAVAKNVDVDYLVLRQEI